jgi:hypothetical protein
VTTASETLDAAADLIEQHGWNRGSFSNADGGMCVLGALNRAYGGFCVDLAILSPIHNVGASVNYSIIKWNDEVAFDQADVINHLRKAAEAARAEAKSA